VNDESHQREHRRMFGHTTEEIRAWGSSPDRFPEIMMLRDQCETIATGAAACDFFDIE